LITGTIFMTFSRMEGNRILGGEAGCPDQFGEIGWRSGVGTRLA
jgi:hypothetical protein